VLFQNLELINHQSSDRNLVELIQAGSEMLCSKTHKLITVCTKIISTEIKRLPVDTNVYSCEGALHDRTFSNPEEMV
jgi:hypothetical protein